MEVILGTLRRHFLSLSFRVHASMQFLRRTDSRVHASFFLSSSEVVVSGVSLRGLLGWPIRAEAHALGCTASGNEV